MKKDFKILKQAHASMRNDNKEDEDESSLPIIRLDRTGSDLGTSVMRLPVPSVERFLQSRDGFSSAGGEGKLAYHRCLNQFVHMPTSNKPS